MEYANSIRLRREMIDALRLRGIKSERVLKAMSEVPRERFMPPDLEYLAYEDQAAPIWEGQTISEPYTVAFMLQEAKIRSGQKVLEIGTGSGYNCANISKLVGKRGKVVSVEVRERLATRARNLIQELGYPNVKVVCGDGSLGYEPDAPYDRIMVTAGPEEVSAHWTDQLKTGGILIAPVGVDLQVMKKFTKAESGVTEESLGFFQFVPLVKG